ncbi:hypothetical protein LNV23_07005 [Paucibacter sp. DJ1R-11]|uniref:hypothetical protein n=1 Tax=unclassified Roseateles TaxID=2626991 RepID=UPI0021E39AE3|nr:MULTISPECIES: hypothetical protein [unclassified Roseateles]MCV2363199.1 hypothetical protein [Paucibacter sp. DJ1R-11]MCV2421742.1 hypothetical protein [Paucibacter sp. DJ4R-1]MCV2438447.1 hypothetical protein [Paucibacter sp. DJ2R-2]
MNEDAFFALPPFKAEEALLTLKRNLRDLRSLEARGDAFSLQGQPVLELSAQTGLLLARLVKRPGRSPEWETRQCKSAAEVRSLLDEIKRRLSRWTDETP